MVVIVKLNKNKRYFRFLTDDNDSFGKSLSGVIKCTCISVLLCVWELLFPLFYAWIWSVILTHIRHDVTGGQVFSVYRLLAKYLI